MPDIERSSDKFEHPWAAPATEMPAMRRWRLPDEGDAAFDAAVDALIGQFHFPEYHAERVVGAVIEAIRNA